MDKKRQMSFMDVPLVVLFNDPIHYTLYCCIETSAHERKVTCCVETFGFTVTDVNKELKNPAPFTMQPKKSNQA
jgi:hypothetical protein